MEFLDLHKWRVPPEEADWLVRQFWEEGRTSQAGPVYASVSAERLRNALVQERPDHEYIHKLAPILEALVAANPTNTFSLFCDIGRLPWDIGEEMWYAWKELDGPSYYASYLPRNLIETHACRTWEAAVSHIGQAHDWLLYEQVAEDLREIRTRFGQLLEQLRAAQQTDEG